MTGFASLAITVTTRDGRNVYLEEDLIFTRPNGGMIRMVAGSTSDGASVPEVFWSLGLAPTGGYWLACVLHDGMYRRQTVPVIDSREVVDTILLEAMRASGVPEVTAKLIYDGVRLGGQHAWDEDRGL